jgi:hypothetical protein
MSERPPQSPPRPPPAPPPPPSAESSGCLTALMVIFGIILLLPGLCFLQFGGRDAVTIGAVLCIGAILFIIGAVVRATGRSSPRQ